MSLLSLFSPFSPGEGVGSKALTHQQVLFSPFISTINFLSPHLSFLCLPSFSSSPHTSLTLLSFCPTCWLFFSLSPYNPYLFPFSLSPFTLFPMSHSHSLLLPLTSSSSLPLLLHFPPPPPPTFIQSLCTFSSPCSPPVSPFHLLLLFSEKYLYKNGRTG